MRDVKLNYGKTNESAAIALSQQHSKETKLIREWGKNGPSMVWELERGDTYASPTISDGKLFSFDLAETLILWLLT